MSYTFTTEQQQFLAAVPNNRTKSILRQVFETMDLDYLFTQKYTLEHFQVWPNCSSKLGSAATGVAGDENVMLTDRNAFEYHIIGTQTLLAPVLVATGLDIGMDQTAGDGVEISQGILAQNRMAFTVGTHAFFGRCKFSIGDVSDVAECAFGFREAEAYQAAIDNYTDMAAFNVQAGQINIETIVNNAATVTTDTTEDDWEDGATHELEVQVALSGAVTFLIDGEVPAATKVLTLASELVVVPFFHMLLGSSGTSNCILKEWEVGLL